MPAVTLAVLASLVVKVIDWLKQLQNRQWNAAITQVIVWVAGFAVLLLAAQTQLAGTIPIQGLPLSKLSVWDLILFGTSLGSAGSLGWQAVANLGGGNQEVALPLLPTLKRAAPPAPGPTGSTPPSPPTTYAA